MSFFRPDLAKLRLSVRHNSDDAQIFAGYDLVSQRWHIRERSGADREWVTLAESAVMPLDTAAWHSIRVRAVNSTIELFIDGASVLRTTEASHVSPGRVALAAGGTVARFDDVSLRLLSGQGRVEDGVLDYTLSPEDGVYREGATIVELSNGDLALRHREELFLSTDGGRSFDRQDTHSWPQNAHGHHSIIRLQDGTLLDMVAEYEHPPATGDEPLRFRAYVSDGDGASWEPAGLTWPGFREGLPGRSEVIVMNDKLTQTSTGRIFFAVTVREDDGEYDRRPPDGGLLQRRRGPELVEICWRLRRLRLELAELRRGQGRRDRVRCAAPLHSLHRCRHAALGDLDRRRADLGR